jgi:phage gp36-like protein
LPVELVPNDTGDGAGIYISQADLEAVIPADELLQLADRDGDEVTDTAVVNAAIASAESQVHDLLTRRYALPLDSTDTLLMGFLRPGLVNLAWANLYPRPDMVSDNLQSLVDVFTKRLQDIRDGKADLPATGTLASGPGGGGGPAVIYSAAKRKTQGGMP